MTPRQHQLLNFITFYRKVEGYSPSLEEMAEAMSLKSKSVAHRMLRKLSDEGLVRMKPKAVRSVEVVRTKGLHAYSDQQLTDELRQRRAAR